MDKRLRRRILLLLVVLVLVCVSWSLNSYQLTIVDDFDWTYSYWRRNAAPSHQTHTSKLFEANSTLEKICDEYIRKSIVFTVKPADMEFLPEYKAFCWKTKTDAQCLPTFYLAGFPKCATTDIWTNLVRHPGILDVGKEIHWWDTNRIVKEHSFASYLDHFVKALQNKDKILGDGSPGYFFMNLHMSREKASRFKPKLSEETDNAVRKTYDILPVHVIQQFTPKAKFIISMREPSERMYSHYLHMHATGLGGKASPQNFHRLVLEQIKIFEACSLRRGSSYCAYDGAVRRGADSVAVHLYVGLYIVYVKDALKMIPEENLKFVNFHRYVRNRTDVTKDIYGFLGLDNDHDSMKKLRLEMGQVITGKRAPSLARQGPMLPETKETLRAFYRPYNEELASLLKDDGFLFDDV